MPSLQEDTTAAFDPGDFDPDMLGGLARGWGRERFLPAEGTRATRLRDGAS
jgi:hypothetical protein